LKADSVTGSKIAANSITASHIQGDQLDVVATKTGTLTVDEAIHSTDKTSYDDTTAGFWLGNDGGTYKVNVGSANKFLKWDGNDLYIQGRGRFGGTSNFLKIGAVGDETAILFYNNNTNSAQIWSEPNELTLKAGFRIALVGDEVLASCLIQPSTDDTHDLGTSTYYWKCGYITTLYTDALKRKRSSSNIGESDARFDNIYTNDVWFCNYHDYCSIVDLSEILPKPACKLLEELKVDNYPTQIGKHISHASWPSFVRNLKYVDVPADDKERLKEIKKLVSKQVGVYKKDGKTYITFEVSSINVSIVDSIIIVAIKELNDRLKILETKIN